MGAFKITGIPDFKSASELVFSSFPTCVQESYKLSDNTDDSIFSAIMNDGSMRLSVGSKNSKGVSGDMRSKCAKTANNLRNLVDLATKQLFLVLDEPSKFVRVKSLSDTMVMEPYDSYQELIQQGAHIEHIHAYLNTKSDVNTDADNIPTMAMHTDAGLMIAMTSGYYSYPTTSPLDPNNSNNEVTSEYENGLHMQLPDGEIVHVTTTSDDLIIMMGAGAQNWLAPKFGLHFRAVPHSLYVDLGPNKQATRCWYGKMILPPLDAKLYRTDVTYGSYRADEIKLLTTFE